MRDPIEPLQYPPDTPIMTDLNDDDLDAPDLYDADQDEERGPSKSQRKREKHALQALAERLAGMPRVELEQLGLSAATWSALDETSRIKDVRARGRHWKRIANLLEREDMSAVHALMEDSDARARAAADQLHTLERWRERLIADEEGALSDFITACPEVDRQQLRTLIRAAQRDQNRGRADAPRKLFRFLRDALQGASDDSLEASATPPASAS